ncbi:IS3 family transposase, partial [Aliarcobacter butzleri]
MCKIFNLTRSSYYHWLNNGCVKERVDKPFNNLLKKIFEEARSTYGTRRLKVILSKRYGLIVSRRKIQ